MNYLYITLYYFYTKILFVHRDYPPIISITAVLSMFIMFLIMILIEILNLQHLYNFSWQLKLFFAVISLGFWFLFYKYYLPKEYNLIKRFKKNTLLVKITTFFISTAFIVTLIIVWFNRFKYFRYDWN